MTLEKILWAPWPLLVVMAALVAGCSGGGGGGESQGTAQVLEAVQPGPATPTPSTTEAETGTTGSIQVSAVAIHWQGERSGARVTVGRHQAPLTVHAVTPVAEGQSLPGVEVIENVSDFIGNRVDDLLESTLPDFIVDDILGVDNDDHDPSIHDYFPTGAGDEWTYVDDATILQGADPQLVFNITAPGPDTYDFTLVVHDSGFYFANQEVAGGVISAEPPLLWLPNDLRPQIPHHAAADITYSPEVGDPTVRHVERTITLVERGPHATLNSYFADTLHFEIKDTVTRVPADGTSDALTYEIFLGRGFGPTECSATEDSSGSEPDHTEIERAVVHGRDVPDTDGDGLLDVDDPDDDNDGTPDDHNGGNIPGALVDWTQRCRSDVTACNDAFPKDPAEQADYDGDHMGNNADPDDDNDGVPDLVDNYPFDATLSEGPYRVYLWATDTDKEQVRHLYALDPDPPDPADPPPPVEIAPDHAGQIWGVAVYPRHAGGPADPRVAFLSPAAGANPADADGSHLWVDDEDGLRDLTPELAYRVTRATWETGGESLLLGIWASAAHSDQGFYEADRLVLDPLANPIRGDVWKFRFSPDQRYLAYADDSDLFSDLRLFDRQGGTRDLTPDDDGEILLGIVRKSFSVFELDRDPEFSADGGRLATAGALSKVERWLLFFTVFDQGPQEEIRVWEPATGRLVYKLRASDFGVGHLQLRLPPTFAALSPFGRYLAVEVYDGEDERLDRLDLENGSIVNLADRLPPPETYGDRWEQGAGGWAFTNPPALILPLTNDDGVTVPVRLPADGSAPVELVGTDDASEGPILLSPHGRFVFFIHNHVVWRVDAAGGAPEKISAPFTEALRLEIAR